MAPVTFAVGAISRLHIDPATVAAISSSAQSLLGWYFISHLQNGPVREQTPSLSSCI